MLQWRSQFIFLSPGIMKNLCFRAIAMALGLYFTGTMTNPARKSSIFFNPECQWNEYRLTNCSFTGKQDIPVDISQMAATVDASSIFFRVLLQSPTKEEKQNIKHLDLSNTLTLKITLSPLAHLPGLEALNLSNNAIHSISLGLPRPKCSRAKHHSSSLRSGLLHLKQLVLQRNKLSDIPKGKYNLKRRPRPRNPECMESSCFRPMRIPCLLSVLRKWLNVKQFDPSEYNKRSFFMEFEIEICGTYSQYFFIFHHYNLYACYVDLSRDTRKY